MKISSGIFLGAGIGKLLVLVSHLTHSQFLSIRARKKQIQYSFRLILKDSSLSVAQTNLYLFNVRWLYASLNIMKKNLPFLAENELFWSMLSRNAAVMCSDGNFLNAALLLFIKNLLLTQNQWRGLTVTPPSCPYSTVIHIALYKKIALPK